MHKQYDEFKASGFKKRKKLNIGEVRVLMLKSTKQAWNKMCEDPGMMIKSFRDVGLSLNIDGSEDDQMHFQRRPRGLPSDIIIG